MDGGGELEVVGKKRKKLLYRNQWILESFCDPPTSLAVGGGGDGHSERIARSHCCPWGCLPFIPSRLLVDAGEMGSFFLKQLHCGGHHDSSAINFAFFRWFPVFAWHFKKFKKRENMSVTLDRLWSEF